MENLLILIGFIFICGTAGAQEPLLAQQPPLRGEPTLPPAGTENFNEESDKEASDFLSCFCDPNDFESMKKEHPTGYRMLLKQLMRQKKELDGLKTKEPEWYELKKELLNLELKSRILGKKAKEAQDKIKFKKELRDTLGKLFDIKEKDKEFEIKRMESEISELKNMIERRKKNKSTIIDKHVEELLEEKEYMRW